MCQPLENFECQTRIKSVTLVLENECSPERTVISRRVPFSFMSEYHNFAQRINRSLSFEISTVGWIVLGVKRLAQAYKRAQYELDNILVLWFTS